MSTLSPTKTHRDVPRSTPPGRKEAGAGDTPLRPEFRPHSLMLADQPAEAESGGSHVIEEAENDAENHLCDPQDDRHLHFVGVQERELV